jgi:hypothetical protein
VARTYQVHENEMMPSDCDGEGMVEVIPAWEADPGCEGSMAFHLHQQGVFIRELVSVLEDIRDGEGKVCDDFESCNHLACDSSYGAWAIADEALAGGVDRDSLMARVASQRDMWHRLFNRLDGAVNHHLRDQGETAFSTDADERLYAARRRIYAEAARQGKEMRERGS